MLLAVPFKRVPKYRIISTAELASRLASFFFRAWEVCEPPRPRGPPHCLMGLWRSVKVALFRPLPRSQGTLSLLRQGLRGLRNPPAARAPPLFDGALEGCEKTDCSPRFVSTLQDLFTVLVLPIYYQKLCIDLRYSRLCPCLSASTAPIVAGWFAGSSILYGTFVHIRQLVASLSLSLSLSLCGGSNDSWHLPVLPCTPQTTCIPTLTKISAPAVLNN